MSIEVPIIDDYYFLALEARERGWKIPEDLQQHLKPAILHHPKCLTCWPEELLGQASHSYVIKVLLAMDYMLDTAPKTVKEHEIAKAAFDFIEGRVVVEQHPLIAAQAVAHLINMRFRIDAGSPRGAVDVARPFCRENRSAQSGWSLT
jgi:hypothetical protein